MKPVRVESTEELLASEEDEVYSRWKSSPTISVRKEAEEESPMIPMRGERMQNLLLTADEESFRRWDCNPTIPVRREAFGESIKKPIRVESMKEAALSEEERGAVDYTESESCSSSIDSPVRVPTRKLSPPAITNPS
jgi:hypothetical protein